MRQLKRPATAFVFLFMTGLLPAGTSNINFSTVFGGSNETVVTSVITDGFGDAIVAGWTSSTDLPANGVKTRNAGGVDAFVAKYSGTGSQIMWCTYLGGSGDDRAFGVAVDPSGNVYVTGWTSSTNFPVTSAIQPKSGGGRDAFVVKLNSTGTAIVYGTYLGGANYDQGNAIAVDSTGAAYIAGDTSSSNLPVLSAYQSTRRGQQDAFVAKFSPTGTLVFSTYLGGTADDHAAGIALDSSNNVYVTGSTYSSNFPVFKATQALIGGGQDAYLAELGSAGNTLLFSTFIGGTGGTPGLLECGNGVAVDPSGNAYVGGVTSSIDFPTTSGAYQRTIPNAGHEDHGFAWKVNSAKSIVYSTYIAGTNLDIIKAVAADTAGNAYLAGSTTSVDFPLARGFQTALLGLTNAFILKLNPNGSGLIFGTLLGGSTSDTANSITVDAKQNISVGGLTNSMDFPSKNPAQPYANGTLSAFVTRVVPGWYPITFSNGTWYLDVWHDGGYDGKSGTLASYNFGQSGDVPIVGDWTNSGSTKIGVFRNGLWILDSNGNGAIDSTDRQFTFGQAGDVPVIGDWDGSGTVKAGLFRGGQFILDLSGHMSGVSTGKQDLSFYYGTGTDVPVVGDWGNTGLSKIGVFRSGTWYLDTNNSHSYDSGDQTFVYGSAGATPLVGDWDGSGSPKFAYSQGGAWSVNVEGTQVFKAGVDLQFYYGNSSFKFLVGR